MIKLFKYRSFKYECCCIEIAAPTLQEPLQKSGPGMEQSGVMITLNRVDREEQMGKNEL
jgi:hypothetical protein